MPDFLIKFINSLTTEQALTLREWLDENPNAVEEMIEEVCDKHPEVI